ncbi:MAG: TonB-dependent receptor [Burkholderiales bacterium RIFCSPHIGHO2_01_FULL_63_240]|jgi:catecholate siderophore receptor|nr:MAG: TonB-dependent receptor [Burkholderiales bacterium RIFCSPHIGHO2_01_FULL_63_240]
MAKPASIRSRKHAPGVHPFLGTSLVALSALTTVSTAVAQTAPQETKTLEEVSVKASRTSSFKAEESASNKFTQPLLDTPKTVQVVKKEVLREQGAASLMEALRNTPGITMQLGEGGNTSAGDTFQMRGFASQQSTFVDGIRDLGAVSRDIFNLEQVEIVKGPAGADVGRGASSGYINLITKLATTEDASEASLTVGSADKKRVTADVNRQLGENSAFRINAMAQDSGTPGRDFVKQKGEAIAPSLAFGLGTPTRIHLYSLHQRQDNVPDGGVPTIGLKGAYRGTATGTSPVNATQAAAINAGRAVDSSNFYGSRDDREKVTADMFTAKIEHDVSPKTTVRNITRYGKSHVDRVLTSVGALVGTNVGNPVTDSSQWTVNRSRQRIDQVNEILVNQTSINTEQTWGGLKHSLVGGLELMHESQTNKGFGTAAQTIRGVSYAAITNPAANLYNPNANDTLGIPYATGVNTDGSTTTIGLYALDTVDLTQNLKVNAGLRLDHYSIKTKAGTLITSDNLAANPGYAVGGIAPSSLSDSDNLVSWNLGVVYKPVANGSVYAAVANALTPPGGNNFVLSASATNQANSALDPQETTTIEVGTKWDLLDEKLNVSAAIYRAENDKQTSVDSFGQTLQFGKTRVDGIEFAAVGQITNFWQVSAGLAFMDAKQIKQFSSATSENNGVRWSPEMTASVWTSYTAGDFTLGGGVRHVSDQKRVITKGADLSTQNVPKIPSYTLVDLMAAYKVSKNLNLQLNVYNLFDKDHIEKLNNNGGRYTPGAPRTVSLTASVKF